MNLFLFEMENSEEGDIKLNVLEEDYDEMVAQRADVMENVGKKVKIYYDFIYRVRINVGKVHRNFCNQIIVPPPDSR